jgi:dodecin
MAGSSTFYGKCCQAASIPYKKERTMSIAKVVEIISASPISFQDAIESGIARANKTLQNVTGAWIKDQKVDVVDGKVTQYRVVMRISFVLKD